MLALGEYRDTLCPCCGFPKSMTQVHERDAPRFLISKRWCWARKTLIETQQAFTDNGKNVKPTHSALQWGISINKG